MIQDQAAKPEASDSKSGNLHLGMRARLLLASGPDRAALEALRDEIADRIATLSLNPSRAPYVFLYQSMVIWLLERRFVVPWDNRIAARVQLWEIEWFNPVLDYQKQFVSAGLAAFPDVQGFQMMETVMRAIPDGTSGFIDKRQKDVVIYRRPGAKLTIFGFSGLNHQLAGIGWTSFDRAVAARLNANLIVLKDFNVRLHLAGVTSIGDFNATCNYLRELLAEFSDTRTVALGGSGGVFGAINIACEIGIDHVVALAGPTSLEIGEAAEAKQVYRKVAEDAKAGLIAYPNLVERVNGAGLRRIDFFVAGQHEFDYAQMRNLADRCPCVVPHVYEHLDTHIVVDSCIDDGTLAQALDA